MSRNMTPPKKNILSYFFPFLIIIASLVLVGLLIQFFFPDQFKPSEKSFAILETERGEVKVLLVGEEHFLSAPKRTKLFQSESVRTEMNSLATLHVLKNAVVTLEGSTNLDFVELEQKKSTESINLLLASGQVWVSLKRFINPDSFFSISAGRFVVTSKGGEFSLESNVVRVAKGEVSVGIRDGQKIIAQKKVGVGQEFLLNDESFLRIKKGGSLPEISALSDDFKLSLPYRRHMGTTVVSPKEDRKESPVTEILTPSEKTEIPSSPVPSKSAENTVPIPQILLPVTNGETFTTSSEKIEISGTITKGASSIEVNKYALTQFKKGDTSWRYVAALQYKNLEKGKRVIIVIKKQKLRR